MYFISGKIALPLSCYEQCILLSENLGKMFQGYSDSEIHWHVWFQNIQMFIGFPIGKIKHCGITRHWFIMQNLMNEVSLASNMQYSRCNDCAQQMAVRKGHCKCVFCMC